MSINKLRNITVLAAASALGYAAGAFTYAAYVVGSLSKTSVSGRKKNSS
jgi:hypothetical protein